MGAIKFTGKAFKIVGEVLSADEVEQWIEQKGKRFLEECLKRTFISFAFGESLTQAQSKIRRPPTSLRNMWRPLLTIKELTESVSNLYPLAWNSL